MAAYRLSAAARADLAEITRHTIARWGPIGAEKYIHELQSACDLLVSNPAIGRSGEAIGQGLRRFTHASHVIWYTATAHNVTVLRILHKSMLPQKHLT